MNKIEKFIEMVDYTLKYKDLRKDPDFSVDAPEFAFDFIDEMEKEAPLTNDLIQTGNIIQDIDGYALVEGSKAYYEALQKDIDEIKAIYKKEKSNKK